jgi:hypothetical protein
MSDYGGDDEPACAALVSELRCPALRLLSRTNVCSSTASDQIMEKSLTTSQKILKKQPQNRPPQKIQMSIKPMKISKK